MPLGNSSLRIAMDGETMGMKCMVGIAAIVLFSAFCGILGCTKTIVMEHPYKTKKELERDTWLCEKQARMEYSLVGIGRFAHLKAGPNVDDVMKCLRFVYGWEEKSEPP